MPVDSFEDDLSELTAAAQDGVSKSDTVEKTGSRRGEGPREMRAGSPHRAIRVRYKETSLVMMRTKHLHHLTSPSRHTPFTLTLKQTGNQSHHGSPSACREALACPAQERER